MWYRYAGSVTFVFQCPLSCAAITNARKTPATANPILLAENWKPRRVDIVKQSPTGQAVTHCMQPVHSTEPIDGLVATGKRAGQTRVHLLQSMQVPRLRRMRSGEAHETNPSSAPYGQP